MKEIVERVIEMGFQKEPEKLVAKIEALALEMKAKGYYFVESKVDRNFDSMTLFFMREF